MNIKANDLINCDKEIVFPFIFTYIGAFKWYKARNARQHPQKGKEDMVLIDGWNKQRNNSINIQLPKDMEVEIYDGIAGEWPE